MSSKKPIRTGMLLLLSTLGIACLALAYQFDLLASSSSASRFPHYHITDLGPLATSYQRIPWKGDLKVVLIRQFQGMASCSAWQRIAFQSRLDVNDRNRNGECVGSEVLPGRKAYHAILWQGQRQVDLGTLGGVASYAQAINAKGQIVGNANTAGNRLHAFLWQEGRMSDLGTLGGLLSTANAINDQGWIVGTADAADGATRAFLYREGQMLDLGTLGGLQAEAYSLNNSGQIVGSAHTVAGTPHAFLWQAGQMVDLNRLIEPSSGWMLETACFLDEEGHIGGVGQKEGQPRRYLLTPQCP